jgi:hypothetical protein
MKFSINEKEKIFSKQERFDNGRKFEDIKKKAVT